eukprot:gene7714-12184_t
MSRNNSFLSYFTKEDDLFTGIVINLKSAEIYNKTSTGSAPSPYFIFSVKGSNIRQKSITKKKSLSPIFNDTLFLKIEDPLLSILEIELFDKNFIKDVYLGKCEIDLTSLHFEETKEYTLMIIENSFKIGIIQLTIESHQFGRKRSKSLSNMSVKLLHEKRYEKIQKIGQGGMSNVFLYNDVLLNKKIVIKQIKCETISEMNSKLTEFTLLKGIKSNYLVEYEDIFVTEKKESYILNIVMHYFSEGDLSKYLKKLKEYKKYITENELIEKMKQITLGLNVLHKNKIMHRDLKPENIFIKNESKELFIGDFGIATKFGDDRIATTTTGTMKYIAPEIMTTQQGYDEKADIWSLGCLFFEIATLDLNSIFYLEIFKNPNFYEEILKQLQHFYSKKIYFIIRILLERNPMNRPSTEKLLDILHQDYNLSDHINFDKFENPNSFNSQIIEKITFFKNESNEFKKELIRLLEPKIFEKGAQIIEYNEDSNEMYFINKGVVNCISGDESESVVNVISEGTFGEFGIVYESKRSAHVFAFTDCDLFLLSKENFNFLNQKFPKSNLKNKVKRFRILPMLKSKLKFSFSEELLCELSEILTPVNFADNVPIFPEKTGKVVLFIYRGFLKSSNGQIIQKGAIIGGEVLFNDSHTYTDEYVSIGPVYALKLEFAEYKIFVSKFPEIDQILT